MSKMGADVETGNEGPQHPHFNPCLYWSASAVRLSSQVCTEVSYGEEIPRL